MNTSQAPSLPYVRDEASTSQILSAYQSYHSNLAGPANDYALTSAGTEDTAEAYYDEEALLEEDTEIDHAASGDGSALQYWAAKRHMAGKKSDAGEEDYGEVCTKG